MAKGEALDAVKDDRPFAGVHILATAMMCGAGASGDELELARRILERDPKTDAPRESESVAGCFNRHMDAAIGSVDRSRDNPTRTGRRAQLARDLDAADLVLMDRAMVAALMVRIGELKDENKERRHLPGPCGACAAEQAAAGGIDHHEDYGEFGGGEEPFATVATDAINALCDRIEFANGGSITFDGNGDSFAGLEYIEGVHGPIGGGMGDYSNPNVND